MTHKMLKGVVSKETVVLRRWGSSLQKFGFINGVDNVNLGIVVTSISSAVALNSKVIPKGFRSNFHASTFSQSNQYLHQIRCAQNSFSRNIMRITIRAMCQKLNVLDKTNSLVPLRTFQNLSSSFITIDSR